MSRRRRRSGSKNQPDQQQRNQQSHQNQQQNRSKAAAAADGFWGDVPGGADAEGPDGDGAQHVPAVERIRPTPDPGALPRSLGDPPLTPDTAAAHHVAVVYEEAVRAATALAAANGLLDVGDVPGD